MIVNLLFLNKAKFKKSISQPARIQIRNICSAADGKVNTLKRESLPRVGAS
jgi:hypothetical protein